MKNLSKNVYFEDVTVVFQSTINGGGWNDLFLTKDEAIKWTKEALAEWSEELTEEEMERYGFNKDAEDYIEEIKLNPSKDLRAATDGNGKLILESFDELDGEWHPCVYVGSNYLFSSSYSCPRKPTSL